MTSSTGKKMSKFTLLLKTNITILAAYIWISLVSIPPFFLLGTDIYWYEGLWERGFTAAVYTWLWVMACTLFSFSLCFVAGNVFLKDTQNKLTNLLSVIAIPISTLIYIFYYYLDSSSTLLVIWGFTMVPIYPICNTISYFLHIDVRYCYMLMSLLPTLLMLSGMYYDKRKKRWKKKQERSEVTT